MNLYISDLHFGHSNCISFDHRPFADRDEMDHCLIEFWNSRVNKDDNVYIVGDFAYRADKDEAWYLRQLRGHMHLIVGNHDGKLLQNEEAMRYIESVDKMMHVTDNLNGENIEICLCHFPIISWNKKEHGSWHIYGHIHNKKDDEAHKIMAGFDHALNAGCMINNYTPASIRELIYNNDIYRQKVLAKDG